MIYMCTMDIHDGGVIVNKKVLSLHGSRWFHGYPWCTWYVLADVGSQVLSGSRPSAPGPDHDGRVACSMSCQRSEDPGRGLSRPGSVTKD